MSNMENLEPQLNERERQSIVFEKAVASLEAEKTRQSAHGYAVIASLMSYGESAHGTGIFGKVSHGAKLFVIGFAFLAPSLLVWQVLLR